MITEDDIKRLKKETKPLVYIEVEGGIKTFWRDLAVNLLWTALVGFVLYFSMWWLNLI